MNDIILWVYGLGTEIKGVAKRVWQPPPPPPQKFLGVFRLKCIGTYILRIYKYTTPNHYPEQEPLNFL